MRITVVQVDAADKTRVINSWSIEVVTETEADAVVSRIEKVVGENLTDYLTWSLVTTRDISVLDTPVL